MYKFIVAVVASCMLLQASAFSPMRSSSAMRTASRSSVNMILPPSVFDNAVKKWADEYPAAYNVGWGPTTKAERWNGRHAMFGWVALIATGYAKSHGLIPNPDSLLDMKDWGTLAYIYGGSITNERAVILVGHLHLLLFSVCAAVAPLSFQDKLYLEAGEEAEPAAGLIPKIVPGLTPEAEILNGRLAMLGLVVLVLTSIANQTPILDVINTGLGGMLL
mmetsp:Transcript_18338/g.30731  ORF Transcript_18338/g.30731 Transcript_18338/m.30731 type:complete len:219 (-) Transcript_18338:395-1051(-)